MHAYSIAYTYNYKVDRQLTEKVWSIVESFVSDFDSRLYLIISTG